jgi:hypothetical protein
LLGCLRGRTVLRIGVVGRGNCCQVFFSLLRISPDFHLPVPKQYYCTNHVFFFPGDGGKVPDVPGATPRRQESQSESTVPGAKRVKIRSGPYRVPNMMKTNPTGERGMLWNYPDLQIERPCNGECTILRQLAGLEYANGSIANIDSGMWFVFPPLSFFSYRLN